MQAAIDAALQAERERSNRGDETETWERNGSKRGNETMSGAQELLWPVEGEECPYCRDVVVGLVEHLRQCPDGPGFIS